MGRSGFNRSIYLIKEERGRTTSSLWSERGWMTALNKFLPRTRGLCPLPLLLIRRKIKNFHFLWEIDPVNSIWIYSNLLTRRNALFQSLPIYIYRTTIWYHARYQGSRSQVISYGNLGVWFIYGSWGGNQDEPTPNVRLPVDYSNFGLMVKSRRWGWGNFEEGLES